MSDALCSVLDCARRASSHGMCPSHYQRFRRHGDPLGGGPPRPKRTRDPVAFFWGHVVRLPFPLVWTRMSSPCWEWIGSRAPGGYGQFSVRGFNTPAYRFSYELHHGPIPAGFDTDHLCRNHGCVNPEHLEAVTHRINLIRGVGVVAINASKTHCIRGHEFVPGISYIDGRGYRVCRACVPIRRRIHKERLLSV